MRRLSWLLLVGCAQGIDLNPGEQAPDRPPDARPFADSPTPPPTPADARLPDGAGPSGCDEGDAHLEEGGTCYLLFLDDLDWDDAEDACRGLTPPAHLASVTTSREADLLGDLAGLAGQVWLGASDAGDEGDFRWSDGEPFGLARWNVNEPNNDGEEDCVTVHADGYWRDTECDKERAYFCER